MKANEIRKCLEVATAEVFGQKAAELQKVGALVHTMQFLGEIAAQLAEANEHLACLAHPLLTVVNAESQWVEFQFGGNRFNVDKSEVYGCRAGSIGEMQTVTISLRNGTSWCTEGTYAEACAKLGIPVEEP